MLRICYGNTEIGNQELIKYLKILKSNNKKFRVVDVGSTSGGWSTDLADVFVDINAYSSNSFRFNLSIQDEWTNLLNYVNVHGKFDFAITTHTIEDIGNPRLLLTMLPKIAKQGYITAPSIRTELSNVESPNWLGYIHHRHIIDHKNKKLVIAPKLDFIKHLIKTEFYYDPSLEEISIFWEDNIEFEFILDDYLGPNCQTVLTAYKNFINQSYNHIIPNKWY